MEADNVYDRRVVGTVVPTQLKAVGWGVCACWHWCELVALGTGRMVTCNLMVSNCPEILEMTPKPRGCEIGAFNGVVSLVTLLLWVQVCGMHLYLFLQACQDGSTAPAPVQGLPDSKQKYTSPFALGQLETHVFVVLML